MFHKAWDLVTDINLEGWSLQLSIESVVRSAPDERGWFDWTTGGDLFSMRFSATGFTQYLRQAPIYTPGQRLSVGERGGIRTVVDDRSQPVIWTNTEFDRRGFRLLVPQQRGKARYVTALRADLRYP